MGFPLDDPNKRPLNLADGDPLSARLKEAVTGSGAPGTKALVSLLRDGLETNPAVGAVLTASDADRGAALRSLLASPGVAAAVLLSLSELGGDAAHLAAVLNEVASGNV